MWHQNVPGCFDGIFCCFILKVIKPTWFESRVLAIAETKVPSFLFFFFSDIWNPLGRNNYRDIVCFSPSLPCKVLYIKMRVPLLHSTTWGGFRTYWRLNLPYLYWLLARTMYQGGHLSYGKTVFFIRYHDPLIPTSQLLARTRGVNRSHRHTCRGSGKKAQQMQALN